MQVFARGGMQSKTGDTPQRNGALGMKGANAKTRLPCTLCKVTQSAVEGELGGELGDRSYDIIKNRRTRGQVEEGRRQMVDAGSGTLEAIELSKNLGILQPDTLGLPRALYDTCSFHSPMVACGPELLHLNDLVCSRSVFQPLKRLISLMWRRHQCSLWPREKLMLHTKFVPHVLTLALIFAATLLCVVRVWTYASLPTEPSGTSPDFLLGHAFPSRPCICFRSLSAARSTLRSGRSTTQRSREVLHRIHGRTQGSLWECAARRLPWGSCVSCFDGEHVEAKGQSFFLVAVRLHDLGQRWWQRRVIPGGSERRFSSVIELICVSFFVSEPR